MTLRYGFCVSLLCLTAGMVPASETVLAEWDFSRGIKSLNSGLKTAVRGNGRIENGWLTGTYEEPEPRGLIVQPAGCVNFSGGFRIEAKVRLRNEDFNNNSKAALIVADTLHHVKDAPGKKGKSGFALELRRTIRSAFLPVAHLGFGKKAVEVNGTEFRVTPDREFAIAFEYDGIGRARFWLDGVPNTVSLRVEPGGAVAPSGNPLVIGDQGGGNYEKRAGGDIRSLRILSCSGSPLQLWQTGRTAFIRGEKNACLRLALKNTGSSVMKKVFVTFPWRGVPEKMETADLLPGEERILNIPLETRLKKAFYPLAFHAEGRLGGKPFSSGARGGVFIANELPERLPVISWEPFPYELSSEECAAMGFTHETMRYEWQGGMARSLSLRYAVTPGNFENELDRPMIYLDRNLFLGVRTIDVFTTGFLKFLNGSFIVRDRNNRPLKRPVEFGKLRPLALDGLKRMLADYGSHPGLEGALIHSEGCGKPYQMFACGDREGDRMVAEEYRKQTGKRRPGNLQGMTPPKYYNLAGVDMGVIPEDQPVYRYFRWLYSDGLVWNRFNSEIAEIYRKYARPGFWTFHDPVIRGPASWDRGASFDVVSNWTYAYPEPLRFAAELEDVRAMAAGRPGQQYMNMLQFIWYRNAVAPEGVPVKNGPEWLRIKGVSKNTFIPVPPDILEETTWLAVSRNVFAMPYYSLQTLLDTPNAYNPKHPYPQPLKTLNPASFPRLRNVMSEVLLPLGGMLRHLQEPPNEVVQLFSFSQLFSSWSRTGKGWSCEYGNLMLQWANLNPGVIYEEQILRDHLAGVKVLCLFEIETLPVPVIEEIRKFQLRGGIVVGDPLLLPAVTPNLTLPETPGHYSGDVKKGKADLQKLGLELKQRLSPQYRPYSDSSSPDLITRVRSFRTADYLFVINDRRDFGPFLGSWKRVMERGLPNHGTVTAARKAGAVYDVLSGKEIPFESGDGFIRFRVDFSTCNGKLFLILPEKIGTIQVSTDKKQVKRGDSFRLDVKVLDRSGKVMDAVFPFELAVTDGNGENILSDRYPAAAGGRYSKTVLTSLNDPAGDYTVTVKFRFTGETVRRKIRLL